jgi:hypothetical protein
MKVSLGQEERPEERHNGGMFVGAVHLSGHIAF